MHDGYESITSYRKRHNPDYSNGGRALKVTGWGKSTVNAILKNEVYLGWVIGNRSVEGQNNNGYRIMLDREQWIIRKGCHEAIISQEIWDKVREHIGVNGKRNAMGPIRKHELIRCAYCGGVLVKKGRHYYCVNGKVSRTKGCSLIR